MIKTVTFLCFTSRWKPTIIDDKILLSVIRGVRSRLIDNICTAEENKQLYPLGTSP